MTLDELRNLDPERIGDWPLPVKLVLILVIMAVIIFAGWHFDIQHLRVTIENEKKKEVEQIASLESKQKQAANLEALKRQMQEMQQSFGDMLRQLPNRTEVAGLLVDISQTGLAAGLEFELFKPAKEVPSEFYAELPIQISVIGDYHKFGEFISGVAALPRIVTTHDISIQKRKGKQKQDAEVLVLQATAKTYRALDEEEDLSSKPSKPAPAKGKKK
jgi:type IV pilus assembly protein PilO